MSVYMMDSLYFEVSLLKQSSQVRIVILKELFKGALSEWKAGFTIPSYRTPIGFQRWTWDAYKSYQQYAHPHYLLQMAWLTMRKLTVPPTHVSGPLLVDPSSRCLPDLSVKSLVWNWLEGSGLYVLSNLLRFFFLQFSPRIQPRSNLELSKLFFSSCFPFIVTHFR